MGLWTKICVVAGRGAFLALPRAVDRLVRGQMGVSSCDIEPALLVSGPGSHKVCGTVYSSSMDMVRLGVSYCWRLEAPCHTAYKRREGIRGEHFGVIGGFLAKTADGRVHVLSVRTIWGGLGYGSSLISPWPVPYYHHGLLLKR